MEAWPRARQVSNDWERCSAPTFWSGPEAAFKSLEVRKQRRKVASLPPFGRPSKARSANMRQIRGRDNHTTDQRLRSLLAKAGVRGWVLHTKQLPYTPDLYFNRAALAVFVDGCFWHGCPNCGRVPRTNTEYWTAKIDRNRKRDARARRTLNALGYGVIRIWECQLRRHPDRCVARIVRRIGRPTVYS